MKRLLFSSLIIILSLVFLSNNGVNAQPQKKSYEILWDAVIKPKVGEMPEWLINSHFISETKAFTDNNGNLLLLLGIKLSGVSGNEYYKIVKFSAEGKKLMENDSLVPGTDEVSEIAVDESNRIYISGHSEKTIEGERYNIPFGKIFSPELKLVNKDEYQKFNSTVPVFFGANSSYYRLGLMYQASQLDGIKLESKNYPALFVIKYNNDGKVLWKNVVPNVAVDFSYIAGLKEDKAGNVIVLQNATILHGPDHHDVNVFSFSSKGNLNWKKQLKGESELTHMYANDFSIDPQNNIYITGNSDSKVNFAKPDQFTGDTTPPKTLSYTDENGYTEFYTEQKNNFNFLVKYNKKGDFSWVKFPETPRKLVAASADSLVTVSVPFNSLQYFGANGKELAAYELLPVLKDKSVLTEMATDDIQKEGEEKTIFIDGKNFYRIFSISGSRNTTESPEISILKCRIIN